MAHSVETRLKGTARSYFIREFFTNSAHFPLANIFLELLLHDPTQYLLEPDPYLILSAALIQAWVISNWAYHERPRPLLGNLVGPLLYSLGELFLDGTGFSLSANHMAYWVFALGIGSIQQLRLWLPAMFANSLILMENVLRTCILLAMYTILEFIKDDYASLGDFLASPSHLFVVLTIPFIGLMTGFANTNAERYLGILRETADQLREYSQWLLGKNLLNQAMNNPRALSLNRHERSMLFMDIRGFTAWSESQEPEQVVQLMNDYYSVAEPVWREYQALKVKFTADEIMLVFEHAHDAIAAALALVQTVSPLLEEHGLCAGTGLHCGPVVEGLMGAGDCKGYDLLGDSVNTAKRLCDNAAGDEILLSQAMAAHLSDSSLQLSHRSLTVKGKQEPLQVTVIQ